MGRELLIIPAIETITTCSFDLIFLIFGDGFSSAKHSTVHRILQHMENTCHKVTGLTTGKVIPKEYLYETKEVCFF